MSRNTNKTNRNGRNSSKYDKYNKKSYTGKSKAGKATESERESTNAVGIDNDSVWYSNNPQLLHDTANIPFNRSVGTRSTIEVTGKTSNIEATTLEDTSYTLPGVLTIHWMPSVGVSNSADSVVNIAARNLYSFIRQANSGGKNYDSTDLMLYLLAMDSCYAFHSYMMRLYGSLMFTAPTQRYLPKYLVQAMGGDYEDLVSNMANFRAYINAYGARLGAMAVPNDMYYFTRHRWMSSNIYADQISVKPQLYVYVPSYLYMYTYDKDGAGMLKPISVNTPSAPRATLRILKSIGDSLLAPIIGDEDFNIMSGDILKAYGGNIVAIPTVADNYVVPVSYSSEVLTQIHNIQYTPISDAAALSYSIQQDADKAYLISTLTTELSDNIGIMSGAWLDADVDLVTPKDTMIMSRLINCYRYNNADKKVELYAAGSELVTSIMEWGFSTGPFDVGEFAMLKSYNTMMYYDYSADPQDIPPLWLNMDNWWKRVGYGSFDKAPLCGVCIRAFVDNSSPGTLFNQVSITGQKNNMTFTDDETIEQMHETALLSMFNVPAMGVRK